MPMKKLLMSALGGILLAASPSLAFHDSQLDPSIAHPLMAMFQEAYMQCQMGNQMACQYGQMIQGAAQEMLQYQSQCQQGDQQACQQYQIGAAQVYHAFQQFQTANAPIQPDPSLGQLSHEERMRLQRQAFDAHNQQWYDDQRGDMERNQQHLDNLLR